MQGSPSICDAHSSRRELVVPAYPPLFAALVQAGISTACWVLAASTIRKHMDWDQWMLFAMAALPGAWASLACLQNAWHTAVFRGTALVLNDASVAYRRYTLLGRRVSTLPWRDVREVRLTAYALVFDSAEPLRIPLSRLSLPGEEIATAANSFRAVAKEKQTAPGGPNTEVESYNLECPTCRSPVSSAFGTREIACTHCGEHTPWPQAVSDHFDKLEELQRESDNVHHAIEKRALLHLSERSAARRSVLRKVGWGTGILTAFCSLGAVAKVTSLGLPWTRVDTLAVTGFAISAILTVLFGYAMGRVITWLGSRVTLEVPKVAPRAQLGLLSCHHCNAELPGPDPIRLCPYCGATNVAVGQGAMDATARDAKKLETAVELEATTTVASAATAVERVSWNLAFLSSFQIVWIQSPLLALILGGFVEGLVFLMLPGVILAASAILAGWLGVPRGRATHGESQSSSTSHCRSANGSVETQNQENMARTLPSE